MKPKVKTLLFGCPQECETVGKILGTLTEIPEETYEYHHVQDVEEFERALATYMPSLVVVLADGAAGMESVYRSRQRRPSLPVLWFSNDREFGIQSYRLECAYFSTKPVTPEKIISALRRCTHVSIRYTI
jgi:DNA-binding NtrC family response regulator